MSGYLLDTNLLVRLIVPQDPLNPAVESALGVLRRRGVAVSVAPQNLVEFWAVVTRPVDANGLGLSPERAAVEADQFQEEFRVLDEPAQTFQRWRQLVQTHAVKGRAVYDARLAAVMIESGIGHILTFNVDDFRRYPGIEAVSPRDLAAATTPPAQGGVTE